MNFTGQYYTLPYDNDGQYLNKFSEFVAKGMEARKIYNDREDIINHDVKPDSEYTDAALKLTLVTAAKGAGWLVDNGETIMTNGGILFEQINDPRTWTSHEVEYEDPLLINGTNFDTGMGLED